MKSSIAKGIIGNGLAQITIKVIRVFDQLLLVPFFLVAWGPEYYGEWLTLSTIPSILGFSDFGVGSAAGNSFVLAYAANKRQQAANIRKSGLLVISLTILGGTLLTIAALFIAKFANIFDKTSIPTYEAITAISLLMIGRFAYFYNYLTEGYFRGARKAALGAFMYSGYSIMNILAGLCALHIGCGVVGFAFSQFIISILYTILYFYIGNKLIDFGGCKGKIIISDVKTLFSKGVGYMTNPIWSSVYFQGTTFIVRVTLGPESVTIFNTMRTACRSVSQLFNIINGTILPELQYEYGKGNTLTVHRLFRISILTSIVIGIVGTTLLMIFGLDIYNIWTKSILSAPRDVWYTFIASIFFYGIWWTCMVAYPATNKPYNFAIASTTTACLSVPISYILATHLGLWGAALGTLLFESIMMLYILPDSCRLLGMKVADIFTNIKEDLILIKNRRTK